MKGSVSTQLSKKTKRKQYDLHLFIHTTRYLGNNNMTQLPWLLRVIWNKVPLQSSQKGTGDRYRGTIPQVQQPNKLPLHPRRVKVDTQTNTSLHVIDLGLKSSSYLSVCSRTDGQREYTCTRAMQHSRTLVGTRTLQIHFTLVSGRQSNITV